MGTEVVGMNQRGNQQACKLNLCRYQEQVGWEDVIIQQMCMHVLPHHSAVVEMLDEVKPDIHL